MSDDTVKAPDRALWARPLGELRTELGATDRGLDAAAALEPSRTYGENELQLRYLASPAGVALPAMLVDVTALIAGGLCGIVSKPRDRHRP